MKWTAIIAVLVLGLTALSATAAGEGWLTDFEKAKKEAADTKRPILADFSGSDWCYWCVTLDKEVLSQAAFKAFARDNLVLFNADFPRTKQQSAALSQQNEGLSITYAVSDFPTVLLLDATGKELARTGYLEGGAKAYVVHLKELLKGKTVSPAKQKEEPAN